MHSIKKLKSIHNPHSATIKHYSYGNVIFEKDKDVRDGRQSID